MHIHKYQSFYSSLTTYILGALPGSLWNTTPNRYPPQDEFIIRIVQPPDSVKARADLIIHGIIGANQTSLIAVVEDKDTFTETVNAAWEAAIEHLPNYRVQSREENRNKRGVTDFLPYSMCGRANVGRYPRCYVLKLDEAMLQNHPSTGESKTLHFKNDELEIVAIVKELVREIILYGFPSFSPSSSFTPHCCCLVPVLLGKTVPPQGLIDKRYGAMSGLLDTSVRTATTRTTRKWRK